MRNAIPCTEKMTIRILNFRIPKEISIPLFLIHDGEQQIHFQIEI